MGFNSAFKGLMHSDDIYLFFCFKIYFLAFILIYKL